MKIGRQAPTILLPWRSTPAQKKQFSRPMTGHTPQKLPPRGRNLLHHRTAYAEHPLRTQAYDTTPAQKCQAFFQNILQSFVPKFGDNADFSPRTFVRHWKKVLKKSFLFSSAHKISVILSQHTFLA